MDPRFQVGDLNCRFILPFLFLAFFCLPVPSLPLLCPPFLSSFAGSLPIQLFSCGAWGSAVSSLSGPSTARPTDGFWCILKSPSRDSTVVEVFHIIRPELAHGIFKCDIAAPTTVTIKDTYRMSEEITKKSWQRQWDIESTGRCLRRISLYHVLVSYISKRT